MNMPMYKLCEYLNRPAHAHISPVFVSKEVVQSQSVVCRVRVGLVSVSVDCLWNAKNDDIII
jgi:hypothetical protein